MSGSTYNTKQKKLVLDIIKNNSSREFSCDEITNILLQQGTPVGKTTVYRQLEKLVSDGKIKKINSHNGKNYLYRCVDESLGCEGHMHLRCLKCGMYVHLGCDFMHKVSEHIAEHHNFTIDNTLTEILGVCDSCASNI